MRKGFTLIELLAVIVILAVLAVIAVPIVLNIIDDSKSSALIQSGESYLDSLEQAIMQKNSNTLIKYEPSTCFIQQNGDAICDEESLIVDVNGEKPSGGVIVFKSGKIDSAEIQFETGIITLNDKKSFVYNSELAPSSTDEVVYFDVAAGKTCSANDYNEENSKTGYNGINNKTGKQNSCLKFYVLKDNGTTLDLILDHNTTIEVAWNSSKTYSGGPKEVLSKLKTDTASWTGVITPSNYTVSNSLASYTVNYSGFKARLITIEEINSLVGNTDWNGSYFFLDTGTHEEKADCKYGNTTGCKYGWLYDRTSLDATLMGALNNSDVDMSGYWTASSAIKLSDSPTHSWCTGHVSYGVSYVGRIGWACVSSKTHYGIRPVIKINK